MNGTFNSSTTTLKENGVVKKLPTAEFFEIIAKEYLEKSKTKMQYVFDEDLTIEFLIGTKISAKAFVKVDIEPRVYKTTYKDKPYNIHLPKLEFKVEIINNKVKAAYMTHNGEVLDLPNIYKEKHMCIGSMNKNCYPNKANVKAWAIAYITSEWNGELGRERKGFVNTHDLFKWLETPHKSYQKIIRKGNK